MGAILFIFLSVLIYTTKILHHSRQLTFDKWSEIFISFFIFTNCLGYGLPLVDLDLPSVNGVFGYKFRMEVYMIITPVFFILMQQRMQWKLLPIPWYVLLGIIIFCAVNIMNPNNMAVSSTIIALAQLLCYIIFLYIICSCVTIESMMRGIYEGLLYTTILQAFLTVCYPILGITQVVDLFREEVSIRAEQRPGAPGTFNHPNSLGGYMAFVITFFTSCYLMGYYKRKSLILSIVAFFVLIFTFSRTALLATIAAVIVLIVIYKTRHSSIFTIRNIFTIILPLLLGSVALIFLTPIRNSFIGSNMDEMMLARLLHFYCGYEIITEHPFIGVGLNAHLEYIRNTISFGSMFGDVNKIFWRAEEFMFSNPIHNILLICLSEFGIIGTLPVIFFAVRRLLRIKKNINGEGVEAYKILSLFSIGLICCIGIHGMADWAPFSTLPRNLWIMVFFITAVGSRCLSEEKRSF